MSNLGFHEWMGKATWQFYFSDCFYLYVDTVYVGLYIPTRDHFKLNFSFKLHEKMGLTETEFVIAISNYFKLGKFPLWQTRS